MYEIERAIQELSIALAECNSLIDSSDVMTVPQQAYDMKEPLELGIKALEEKKNDSVHKHKDELRNLYDKADSIVSNIVKSRLDHDKHGEASALFEAESFLVDAMQTISVILEDWEG